MERFIVGAIIAGIIAILFGVGATFIVDQITASDDLSWALIAVGFASFFAGAAGYISGRLYRGDG
jgi:hypothetical protein